MEVSEERPRPDQTQPVKRLINSLLVIPVWIVVRLYTLSQLGLITNFDKTNYQDVNLYAWWSETMLQSHQLPADSTWQYPPGAIFMFLLPRLFVTPYHVTFIALLLVFDAVATLVLAKLARRTGNWFGVWFWLLAIAVTGNITLLRFDLVPTALVIAALSMLATSRSGYAFGVVVGLATAVKAWPLLVLLGARTIRELLRAIFGVAVVLLVVFWAAYALFGDPFSFVRNHAGRGLEIEALAATPWYVWQFVTGEPLVTALRNGSIEIVDPTADAVARVLFGVMAALGLFLALWWLAARDAQRKIELSIDAVFAAALLYVCVSEVLSPQYFIWLIGIAAVRFCLPGTKFPWRFASFFTFVIVLNRLMLDNWGDLVSNGRTGVALLIVRNLCLAAMAVYFLVRLVRSARLTRPFGAGSNAPPRQAIEDTVPLTTDSARQSPSPPAP